MTSMRAEQPGHAAGTRAGEIARAPVPEPSVRLALLLLLPLAAGCLLDPYCGPEGREVETRASISAPGVARVERLDLYAGQSKADRAALGVFWRLTGVDFQFHVRAIRVVVGASDSVLFELPLPPFELAGSLPVRLSDARSADRLYDILLNGEAAAVILTDIPGRERIARTLEYRGGYGWSRASCD